MPMPTLAAMTLDPLALAGALAVGVALGLLGSGGGILTVPILVYLVGHDRNAATAESLAIVGAISLVSAIRLGIAGRVDIRRALAFGVPGIAGAAGGGWIGGFVPGAAKLIILAVVMLTAAAMMARRPSTSSPDVAGSPANQRIRPVALAIQGLLVGVLTGLVGVGGGFLIVPALVLLGGLGMHLAVGTSLAIITLNSASGLITNLRTLGDRGGNFDWSTVAVFAAVGIVGSLVGASVGTRLDQRRLRRLFALFLVALAVFILWKESGLLLRKRGQESSADAPAAVAGDEGGTTRRNSP